MNILTLIKPLYYDPRAGLYVSTYDAYCAVALGEHDPPLATMSRAAESREGRALCSKALRAQQTASSMGYSNAVCTPLLNEVKFDLALLVDKSEYELFGSTKVRTRFVEAFVRNQLVESHAQLEMRIIGLLEMVENSTLKHLTCFSHSFFIKLVEAYVGSNGLLFARPEILLDYLPSDRTTYPYGTGVTLKI